MADDFVKAMQRFLQQAQEFRDGKRKGYPEPLNKPLLVDPARWEETAYQQEIGVELRNRLRQLCVVHGIDPDAPGYAEQLCQELIEHHVPGLGTTLQAAERRGRPRERDPSEFFSMVIYAVEEARVRTAQRQKKPVMKVKLPTAIKNMNPQLRAALGDLEDSTIERRYRDAMKAWGKALLARDRLKMPWLAELGKQFGKNSKPE